MIECMEQKIKPVVKERKRNKRITEENITSEELLKYAMKHKCFTRDIELDIVYCPMGEELRRKSRHRDGIKYCRKGACSKCLKRCTKAKFKEVVFREGQKILGNKRKK